MKNYVPKKILAIDPSGTGTSGICISQITDNNVFLFLQFKSKDWEEHFSFIVRIIEEHQPNIVIYENTSYIHRRVQGSLNLFKLIGAIANLRYVFSFIEKVSSVAVNQVKSYRAKLLTSKEQIIGLVYEVGRGKGWKYRESKINLHQLDALIVYYLWQNSSLNNVENVKKKVKELKEKKRLGSNQKKQLKQLRKSLLVDNNNSDNKKNSGCFCSKQK